MEYAPDLIADLAQQVTRVFKMAVERRVVPQLTCDNSYRGSPTTRRLRRMDMTP
jgi:hypothetical protein